MSEEILQNERFLSVEPTTDKEDNLYRERVFSVYGLRFEVSHLMGEVLTIVDAAIVDGTQRKALKDLIKARFRGLMESFQAHAKDPMRDLIQGKETE